MGIALSTIPSGPALVTVNGHKHQALDDLTITIGEVTSPIVTALDGEVTQSILRHEITAAYTPDGRWNTNTLGDLFPYLSHRRGQVCTAQAWRFDGLDGEYHSILAGVLTQMPEITFAVDQPKFGGVSVAGMIADTKNPADAASYYSVNMSGSSVADSAFLPDELIRGNYLLDWGSVLANLESQSGWKVTPNLSTEVIYVAGVQRKCVVTSLSCMVSGTPAGLEADDLLDALKLQNDAAIVPGRTSRALAAALTIKKGASTYFYAPKATMVKAGYAFGAAVLRAGEIGFVLSRDFTSGAPAALFQFTAPA